jgi:endo-alpha-1,4-polygalactosaminidase (GH114 family)
MENPAMQKTILLHVLMAANLLGAILAPVPDVSAATTHLKPLSYVTSRGSDSGNSVAAMHLRDQSGTQDDPATYVAFTTPNTTYQGTNKFKLPESVALDGITSLNVLVNYKGPTKSNQIWRWMLYDWTASAWTAIGDNQGSKAGTWSLLTFTVSLPRRFVEPDTRVIRLQLVSSNAGGDAKIDYEAVRVVHGNAPTPASGPTLAGCPIYPVNSIWNTPVDHLPVHARSADWINSIGATTGFHMDFGSGAWGGGPIGMPYNVVSGTQAKVHVTFDYADESDKGPYPIPTSPKIEHGSDHHILIVDKDNCRLYELYDARYVGGNWYAGSGAVWDLYSNTLRPNGWTSADAAGLPILPGLVRYEEIRAGDIKHALRFTAPHTQRAYLWPARHFASDLASPAYPPMGARFRLKAAFDISGYPPDMQIVLRAMKKYGIILADNGSPWYVSGVPDSRWNNDTLHLLDALKGSDFEAVNCSSLMQNINSGSVGPESWQAPVGASWQWQLTGPLATGVNARIFDVDMFDTSARQVASLKTQGKKAFCYISVGTWENWRPDKDRFPAIVLGKNYDGWPGERWLDIRRIDLLAPILRARLNRCARKGFVGVEPDNMDGYTNDTGFPLTYQDQLKFNIWLSKEAHARGLSIGMKNDSDQVADLLPYFDWALTEDCFDQGWCDDLSPFIKAGKPVFSAEYTDTGIRLEDFCPQAKALNFSPILKNRNLDAYRQVCP